MIIKRTPTDTISYNLESVLKRQSRLQQIANIMCLSPDIPAFYTSTRIVFVMCLSRVW